jgi:hypothetical protein
MPPRRNAIALPAQDSHAQENLYPGEAAALAMLNQNRYVNNPARPAHVQAILRRMQGTWRCHDAAVLPLLQHRVVTSWDHDRIWGYLDLGDWQIIMKIDPGPHSAVEYLKKSHSSQNPAYEFKWRWQYLRRDDQIFYNEQTCRGFIAFGDRSIEVEIFGMVGYPSGLAFSAVADPQPMKVNMAIETYILWWNDLGPDGEIELRRQ